MMNWREATLVMQIGNLHAVHAWKKTGLKLAYMKMQAQGHCRESEKELLT